MDHSKRLRDIPDEVLGAAAWRKAWRFYRVALTTVDRERIASLSRAYRRRWGINQEDMAIELDCNPQMLGAVERAGPFASLRLLALVDRVDIERRPAKLDAKSMRIIERRERERERDAAQTAWINADRPESGPIKERMDTAYAACQVKWRTEPEPLPEHDPQRRAEAAAVKAGRADREEDKDIPFT